MRMAIKTAKKQTAYQLGTGSAVEQELIAARKIRLLPDGRYEIFSFEARNGQGEIAEKGDYIKIDSNGYPYPTARSWFEEHHRYIQGDIYEQINEPLCIWQADDPPCEEIDFLLRTGRLQIVENDAAHYFNAFLWGAKLSAAKDATVLFYAVERDGANQITDINFNFVAHSEFVRDYRIL